MTKLAVVTVCSANWLPYACVTFSTVRKNLGISADFFILTHYKGKSFDEAIIRSAESVDNYRINVAEVDLNLFSNVSRGSYDESSLYRLAIDKTLAPTYDRVLYLDCDTLVLDCLDSTMTVDLAGKYIGAVEDLGMLPDITTFAKTQRLNLGLVDDEKYFNAGVIIFDWKKCLHHRIFDTAREALKGQSFIIPDQDVLNLVLRGHWRPLPFELNAMNLSAEFLTPTIRHFTPGAKPWMSNIRPDDLAYREIYRQYFRSIGYEELVAPDRLTDKIRRGAFKMTESRIGIKNRIMQWSRSTKVSAKEKKRLAIKAALRQYSETN